MFLSLTRWLHNKRPAVLVREFLGARRSVRGQLASAFARLPLLLVLSLIGLLLVVRDPILLGRCNGGDKAECRLVLHERRNLVCLEWTHVNTVVTVFEGNIDTQRAAVGVFELAPARSGSGDFTVGVQVLDASRAPIGLRECREADFASALETLSWAHGHRVGIHHTEDGHDLLEISTRDMEGVLSEILSPLGQALLGFVLISNIIRKGRPLGHGLGDRYHPWRTSLLSSSTALLEQHELGLLSHVTH